MNQQLKQTVLSTIDRLLQEGTAALQVGQSRGGIHDGIGGYSARAYSFQTQCHALLGLLGPPARQWQGTFTGYPAIPSLNNMLGTLQGIKASVEHGLMNRAESLVFADAHGGLLEQAEYLQQHGYFLPAGVLGRAVLESHLRKWCQQAGCMPSKSKPTLSDFTQALYGAQHLSKIDMKHVEAMAAIGNDAAHNLPTLKADDVERLLKDVSAFLATHPLA